MFAKYAPRLSRARRESWECLRVFRYLSATAPTFGRRRLPRNTRAATGGTGWDVYVIEATDLVVGDPPSAPLSLGVATGEIVGLLFPPNKPRMPILRALAGLEGAVAGHIRSAGRGRVVVAATDRPLGDALSTLPDLVLLDAASDPADHNLWARLASERALGTSFLVATVNLDQACHGDRVSLASWEMYELTHATTELMQQMTSKTREFLAALGEARHRRRGALAADLRRLNVGSRALLAEMRRCAHGGDEMFAWHAAEGKIAGVSLNDRVLDAVIADGQDQ